MVKKNVQYYCKYAIKKQEEFLIFLFHHLNYPILLWSQLSLYIFWCSPTFSMFHLLRNEGETNLFSCRKVLVVQTTKPLMAAT